MKTIKLVSAAFVALFSLMPASTLANDDDQACTTYSKLGGVMVEFMLPLTMQNFVDIMTGSDPELSAKMNETILSSLDGNDMIVFSKLSEDEGALVGEAAGQISIQLLMSAQASSGDQVTAILDQSCKEIGIDTIIDNQRKSNDAIAASMSGN